MNTTELIKTLKQNKHGLFSERDTVEEAHAYALMLLSSPMLSEIDRMTAIGVYHNTLIQNIINVLQGVDDGDTGGSRVNQTTLQH